ncbi:MAG: hypothetical protein EOS73_26290 [Mesorhizobium sp.]|uniref:hypothetical protein n=1 Tax=Mesorhizobium sp. M7A.F.Ca.ET.027.02.1.1 TaxID=2496655 RepID=UPI000FD393B4|nr:hypothetical protein [Mesorhizobium sp. M7A.F.Ca.ET.027.02.1.1]RVD13021.1 hypothetical protein EN749_25145 [Mesorhizobium sp. M7A.F.Ca.ET.027.02.1.1]RWC99956.1 MAG: hypothetical protein EOS73_26290 [Mesorhizobium sp.]
MAEGYGSKAKPVALDPFQQIVEVHWHRLTHIAFTVHVKSSVTVVNPGQEYTDEFYETITALEDLIDYLGTTEMAYGTPQPVSTFQGWNGHAWGPIADPTVTGLPDISGSAASYGAWAYKGAKSTDVPPTFLDIPRAKWDAVGGAGTGLFLPDNNTAEFKQGTPSIHLEMQEITGAPHFEAIGSTYPDPPNPATLFYAAPFNRDATTPTASMDFAVDGLVAVLDGKAFRAMASASVTTMEPEPSILVAGSVLWVLCERSPDDDPTS